MEHSTNHINDILKRRYWLKENFDWFIGEVVRHRDFKEFFTGEKKVMWRFGEVEGKVNLSEASAGSN